MNDTCRVEKVFPYITQGKSLGYSCCRYSGGTIDHGDTPEAAVLWEACEETGLQDLVVNGYLGRDEFLNTSMKPNRILVRHFFHLVSHHEIPDTGQHYEDDPSKGAQGSMLFEFTWLLLGEADGYLVSYFSAMLGCLLG